jgi:hypothetical protein
MQAAVVSCLEQQIQTQAASLETKDTEHSQLQSSHEALKWDSQQTIESLNSQNAVSLPSFSSFFHLDCRCFPPPAWPYTCIFKCTHTLSLTHTHTDPYLQHSLPNSPCPKLQILAEEADNFRTRLEEEEATFHDLLSERMASSTAQVRFTLLYLSVAAGCKVLSNQFPLVTYLAFCIAMCYKVWSR